MHSEQSSIIFQIQFNSIQNLFINVWVQEHNCQLQSQHKNTYATKIRAKTLKRNTKQAKQNNNNNNVIVIKL